MNKAELNLECGTAPLLNRFGRPFIDNMGKVVSEEKYINAVAQISQAVNRRAEELLANSGDTLKKDKETSVYTHNGDTQELNRAHSDFNLLSSENRLNIVESASVRHVIALARAIKNGDANMQLDCAASKIVNSKLGLEELLRSVNKSFADKSSDIRKNRDIIKQAWSEGQGDVASAIKIARRKIRDESMHEADPILIVWNDIDQNLTEGGRHNDQIPAARYIRIANHRYGRSALEPAVFASVYDALQNQSGTGGAWGRQMFREAGKEIEHVSMVPGVKETFEYAEKHNVDMRLLTTNHFLVAEGLGFILGLPSNRIYGRTPEAYDSIPKPYIIMREMINNPNSVNIVIDDGDDGIIENIRNRSFPDGSSIQDYAFIICKDEENKKYPLKQVLDEIGAPHGVHGKDYFSVLGVLKKTT